MNHRLQGTESLRGFIFVRSDYQMVKINFDDILYIEGLKDYVKIYCEPIATFSHKNLKSIESKLPGNQCIRIHKSYIISIRKITSVQKNAVKIGEKEIPVGETYKNQVAELLRR